MDLGVDGRVYLVAASTSGLGRGVAGALAADGATVWLGSRNEDAVATAIADLSALKAGTIGGAVLDVTDPGSISEWVAAALSAHGRIDGLLVNAGGPPAGTFESFTDHDWQMSFELTIMSAVRLIREVLPTMQRQKQGSILAVTSSTIKEPVDMLLLSNVMRSGVANLMKSLSRDLAQYGVRVNNIVPGRIDTPRVRALDSAAAATREMEPDEVRSGFEQAVPLGRYGTPEEFGRVGAFLLSPAASYVTGEMIVVDGGSMRGVW
jgi:3-oxoacyl-[acyl-carrier protein] reductase